VTAASRDPAVERPGTSTPGEGGRDSGRLAAAALAFAIAALVSSWNPVAAPLGLVVGAASFLLGLRALTRPHGRRAAWTAIVLSGLAIAASTTVLALTAGVGRTPRSEPLIQVPPEADVGKALDSAADRTRAARDRAHRELEAVEPREAPRAPSSPPGRAPPKPPNP